MKNKSRRVIRESEFHFYDVPPEKLELNQETIDSVRRWHEFSLRTGRGIQNAAILDDLCDEILDAWEGDYPATAALKKDVERAKRTHLGGLGRYLNGLVRIGELILNEDPTFTESKKTMKKLNITKEQFNRSNYFQNKYGKLEYVSESGKLFKTDTGKVLKFVNESHQKGEHLYSVIVKKPGGWDGSFQVNAMSRDDALEKARAKIGRGSKILRIEDIGEYKAFDADDYVGFNESEGSFFGIPGVVERNDTIIYQGCKIEPDAFWGDLGEQYDEEHPEDSNHEGFDQWCWDNKEILQAALDEYTKNVDDIDDFGNPIEEGMRRELVPQNGRQSFGHKAAEEEDDDGFTLFSYNTPVARLERSDDGSHLDFILLNDYLSGTTLNHIHSFLTTHKQDDIPSKKLKMMQVGDRVPLMAAESRKLVKEGAGAGYTVEIKDLKFGKIVDYKLEKDEDTYKVKVEVAPGVYEIAAYDYYNDFFWQEHEFGETPDAQIDGGYAIFDIALDGNPDEDDEAWFQLSRELQNRKLDISFDYGHGWVHANLPREGIELDNVDIDEREVYFGIDKLVLNAPDLADAVNSGYQSTFDQGEEDEEDEDGEPVNEVSGWDLEDEDLTLVNSESDGDKLYIVKLWWGSGYMTDNYNAYAFSEEEALNYVVAYIEKNDPETLEAADECAKNLLNEIEQDHISATEMGYDDDFYPEDTPEFQESFLWVDATTEGASQAHYIYAENLAIAEYPKDHDYPMSKDVKRR